VDTNAFRISGQDSRPIRSGWPLEAAIEHISPQRRLWLRGGRVHRRVAPPRVLVGPVVARRLANEQASEAAATAQRLERQRVAKEEARVAALARALEAEQQAAAAAKERDDAALRDSEALARAAMERAAAAAALAPEPSGGASTPADLRAAMLHHEAVALLQLHSQAVAVSNIRNHVTTVLDVDSGNFNRWCDQFLLILGKFSLQGHVREEPPVPISPDWARMDCVVKSWIIATLTDDLGEIIRAQGSTARHAWLAVESQFLGNREARSIQKNWRQSTCAIAYKCRRCLPVQSPTGSSKRNVPE